MGDFVGYSRGLMDASKGLRNLARGIQNVEVKQTFLRAALLHACSFLEAHLNYMADHFKESVMFSLNERGILLERDVVFDNGRYVLTDKLKMSRIHDRIDLLLEKCSKDPVSDKKGWYSELTTVLRIRNSLVHPKESRMLEDEDLRLALSAVLMAADTLYKVVFKKGLPYAKKGIEGGLDLNMG
jgi:hypothetical protein